MKKYYLTSAGQTIMKSDQRVSPSGHNNLLKTSVFKNVCHLAFFFKKSSVPHFILVNMNIRKLTSWDKLGEIPLFIFHGSTSLPHRQSHHLLSKHI